MGVWGKNESCIGIKWLVVIFTRHSPMDGAFGLSSLSPLFLLSFSSLSPLFLLSFSSFSSLSPLFLSSSLLSLSSLFLSVDAFVFNSRCLREGPSLAFATPQCCLIISWWCSEDARNTASWITYGCWISRAGNGKNLPARVRSLPRAPRTLPWYSTGNCMCLGDSLRESWRTVVLTRRCTRWISRVSSGASSRPRDSDLRHFIHTLPLSLVLLMHRMHEKHLMFVCVCVCVVCV